MVPDGEAADHGGDGNLGRVGSGNLSWREAEALEDADAAVPGNNGAADDVGR